MVYLQSLIDNVQVWLEDEGDTTQVVGRINKAIRKVEKLPWEALKRKAVVTPDENGSFLIPPLCRVIDHIYPAGYSDRPDYEFASKAALDPKNHKTTGSYKFYTDEINLTTLEDSLLVDVVQNGQTITQAVASLVSVDEAWVGEQFRLPGDETLYEITAAVADTSLTVFPPVRSETRGASSCVIRPVGLQQYKVSDYRGEPIVADIEVHYRMKHPTLIDPSDMLLFDAEDTVSLEAVKFYLHQTKYDVDARALELDLRAARHTEVAQQAVKTTQSVNRDQTFTLHARNNRSHNRRR